MKYATFLLIATVALIIVIASNSGKSAQPFMHESEPSHYSDDEYIEPENMISDRTLIKHKMEIEIVPVGTIPDDIDLDEWVHEIEYEIMSERCDDILKTTEDIKKLVETTNGSASKK